MSKKIALVTGGTGGIGTQICRRLVDQGFQVVANHLASESEAAAEWREHLRADGYEFGLAAGDVSDFDDAARMVADVEATFGPISVLVNCAGITRDSTLRKMDHEDWQAVINTNLNGVFNVTRQVADGMLERRDGRIVNISSINGQQGQFGQTNYSAAKAGVHGFTMALAREVASKGITVNTVSPGYIITAMTKAIPEDVMGQIISLVPMRRMGNPDDVAAAVAFLASPDADYITGADISVNGGLGMG
jgi:acetoacetyl-CoA reductase